MKYGRINDYYCYDLNDLTLSEAISLIQTNILGLRAINTSFDSGIFTPNEAEIEQGWTLQGKAGVTPIITESLLAQWPISHDNYCDEWWFFKSIPKEFDHTKGFCNMVTQRIADWEEVEFEGCAQIAKNIQRYKPEIVIGNNDWTYIVSREQLKILNAQQKDSASG